jgi:rhamnosyltransferase
MYAHAKKRIAIYVHYDPRGEVREYVLYCLGGLKEVVSDILVVVNGLLSDEGRDKLMSSGVEVQTRENKDFDFGAWKAGIERLGFDNIANYDELLLTNNSYYGPIYPFSEMWSVMDSKDVDFWGVNTHPKMDFGIPPHLQSYWLVFRKKILKSGEWQLYWETLPHFDDMMAAIRGGEVRLTSYFENCGFKSDAYMSLGKYNGLIHENPAIVSDIQVIEDRCPIVKRKFFFDCRGPQCVSGNLIVDFHSQKLMNFLQKSNPEVADLIWDDLLKTKHLSTINDYLSLNFILSSSSQKEESLSKAAVIMYICAEDLAGCCLRYAGSIPEYIDIVIVSTSAKIQDKCKSLFNDTQNKISYVTQPRPGYDDFFVNCGDLIKRYNYICFVHTKSTLCHPGSQPEIDHREHCFVSMLYSADYVRNVIKTFESNPRLGILIPFSLNSSGLCPVIDEKAENRDNSIKRALGEYFGIDDSEPDTHPMAPFGGMFWARANALRRLISRNLKCESFSGKLITKDSGLSMSMIEKLMPKLAQNDGFYTAFVSPDEYASFYLGRLFSMNRKTNACLFDKTNSCNDLDLIRVAVENFHIGANVFLYWKDRRVRLELKYLCYKLLRLLAFGDTKRYYKAKWLQLKLFRRFLRGNWYNK